MDRLSPNLLTTISNFLPWKDRLSVRRLSTKFHSLPCNPPEVYIFLMRQEKDIFTFTLNFQGETNEQRTIEIIQNLKDYGSISWIKHKNNWISIKKLQEENRTIISCNKQQSIEIIDKYMNFFAVYLSLKCIRLAYLDSNFLAKFQGLMDWIIYNRDWEKERTNLELYTNNKTLAIEETAILQFPKALHTFRFSPPEDFKMSDDFWKNPAVRDAQQLVLAYGTIVGSSPGKPLLPHLDIGINYNFVQERIKKKMVSCTTNTWANITIDNLLEYIENALYGEYTLFNLSFGHTFDRTHLRILKDRLRTFEFIQVNANRHIKKVKEAVEEGTHPDEIIVYIGRKRINVIANYACYRGELSIRNPKNSNRYPVQKQ